MLKQKKQVPLTEQRMNWKDHGIFNEYEKAKAKYRELSAEFDMVKIHLQHDGFHVKVGTPK